MRSPANISIVLILLKRTPWKYFLSRHDGKFSWSIFSVFYHFCFITQTSARSWNKLDILRQKELLLCTDYLRPEIGNFVPTPATLEAHFRLPHGLQGVLHPRSQGLAKTGCHTMMKISCQLFGYLISNILEKLVM